MSSGANQSIQVPWGLARARSRRFSPRHSTWSTQGGRSPRPVACWGGLGDDDGDEPPEGGGGSASVGAGHDVTIYPPPGEHEGNEDRYELGCARCDYLGSADTFADAEAIARLHEGFVAVLVDRWEVPE